MGKVMETQKKIEEGVVSGYKAIEDGVVAGYKKIENKFVETFLPEDPRENAEKQESPEKKEK